MSIMELSSHSSPPPPDQHSETHHYDNRQYENGFSPGHIGAQRHVGGNSFDDGGREGVGEGEEEERGGRREGREGGGGGAVQREHAGERLFRFCALNPKP